MQLKDEGTLYDKIIVIGVTAFTKNKQKF